MKGFPSTAKALDILEGAKPIVNRADFREKLLAYQSLGSTWNPAAKLMSPTDLAQRFDEHVADSISITPYLKTICAHGGVYIDIGSGAGFPAIPIAMLVSSQRTVLVERSSKKCAFLRQLLHLLRLSNIQVWHTELQSVEAPTEPAVYTARAVERPHIVDAYIAKLLKPADLYLAQRGTPPDLPKSNVAVSEITDEFTHAGVRRARLFSVRINASEAYR